MTDILTMTQTSTNHTILATFPDFTSAGEAMAVLRSAGVGDDQLGMLAADSAEARQLLESGPKSPTEGAVIGSAIGGVALGLAAVALSGPFGVIAAGPLVALTGGAAAGAGAGGLVGALVGMGIPENEAAVRAQSIRDGGVLVTCSADSDEQFEELLAKCRGVQAQLAACGARDVFGT